jgi:hypothetical protein
VALGVEPTRSTLASATSAQRRHEYAVDVTELFEGEALHHAESVIVRCGRPYRRGFCGDTIANVYWTSGGLVFEPLRRVSSSDVGDPAVLLFPKLSDDGWREVVMQLVDHPFAPDDPLVACCRRHPPAVSVDRAVVSAAASHALRSGRRETVWSR